jgi:hypothetical protein
MTLTVGLALEACSPDKISKCKTEKKKERA